MPNFDLVPGGAPPTLNSEFEVAFATEAGEQRLSLTEAWSVPFESCLPVRRFPSYKGQCHTGPAAATAGNDQAGRRLMVSRLPIRLRPAHNELRVSYLSRLATLHGIAFTELWSQVSSRRRHYGVIVTLDGDLLVAVTGQSRKRLSRALIETRERPDWRALHEPQPGCHRCNAPPPGRDRDPTAWPPRLRLHPPPDLDRATRPA